MNVIKRFKLDRKQDTRNGMIFVSGIFLEQDEVGGVDCPYDKPTWNTRSNLSWTVAVQFKDFCFKMESSKRMSCMWLWPTTPVAASNSLCDSVAYMCSVRQQAVANRLEMGQLSDRWGQTDCQDGIWDVNNLLLKHNREGSQVGTLTCWKPRWSCTSMTYFVLKNGKGPRQAKVSLLTYPV